MSVPLVGPTSDPGLKICRWKIVFFIFGYFLLPLQLLLQTTRPTSVAPGAPLQYPPLYLLLLQLRFLRQRQGGFCHNCEKEKFPPHNHLHMTLPVRQAHNGCSLSISPTLFAPPPKKIFYC